MDNDTPNLKGKTALVTGASRGIGRAMALALAKAGAHVLALARTVGGLEELDDEIHAAGGAASLIPMNLVEGDSVEQLAGALAERFEALDILLLNAAMLGECAPLQDIDPRIWTATLDLNVTANWRLIRALHPLLRKSDDARVVFLTSRVGGEEARAFWGAYAVSKAALEMLAKTYAEETKQETISVSIIAPGAMRTALRAAAVPGEDPMTLPEPSELAPLLFEALTKEHEAALRLDFRKWTAEG